VGDPQVGFSSVFQFTTAPEVVTSVSFVSIGDLGADNSSDNTIHYINQLTAQQSIDFVLHAGDMSYADGNQVVWDEYMRKIESFTAYTPYMTCPGNHEIAVVSYFNVTAYRDRFAMPYRTSNSPSNMFYSFNYGPVHIISIDAESPDDTPSISDEQMQWITQDLQTASSPQNRKLQPWIIAFHHRNLYCSNSDELQCGIFAKILRDLLEDIYYKYKVDLVIAAHKHDYERMTPVYQGKGYPGYNTAVAPVYVVNGVGGNREGTTHFPATKPSYVVTRDSQWGYAVVTANATALHWSFYESAANTLFDEFTITKTQK
jgi:hypothetical protein